jgi:hypothetical protein
MSIEQLGESLLAEAKTRRKKQERKAKLFGAALLGANIGNIYLRNRANKRANEFWKSNIGLLNQRANQFDMGVKWMINHDEMLNTYGKSKDSITGENWTSAFDSMKLKQYQNSPEYTDLYKNNQQAFNEIVMPKLDDDREAYRQELEAYSDFKNIRSTDKATKTAYVSPLKNKLQKAVDLINKQSNVGGWAFSKIGLTPSAELEDVALDKGIVKLPKGLDEELRTDIVSSINTTMSNWNKIQNAVGVKDKFTDIELKSLMKKKKPYLPSIEPDREFKTIYNVASGIEENPNMKQKDFRVSFGKGEIAVSKFLEEFEGSEGVKLTDTQIQSVYLDALKLADYNYKIYVKQKEELGVGALAIPEGGKKTFFDEALQNIIAGDFSYKVGGIFKDEPRGVYKRQTITNLLNLITNKEDITIETSASGKDEIVSVDSNVVSSVISTEDAIQEKNNINRFTTPEEIINNFKTTVMTNPQWSKSSPEIKSEVIKNILEDYPEMSEVLSSQFLDLIITDMKQRGPVDDTKVMDMKQRGKVDDTEVTTFGSILDKDFRKPFEEEREKQERVPLLKVLGLDKESVKNRIIRQAEDFVSGKRILFSPKSFNDWLEETKGLDYMKVKKEDKPELVSEFLEFLKSN